jgi:aminoglycoside/choline kinase family phosphotransferase
MTVSLPLLPAIAWADPAREAAFQAWLAPLVARHGLQPETLAPASADASFRRYFRIQSAQGPRIVMDAPPPQEDVRPFLHVAGLIQAAGLHGPQILEADAEQGFLLLTDLGSTLYLDAVQAEGGAQAERLMREAVAALVQWQAKVDASSLPPYDDALLRRELALFPEWCVQREYGVTWTAEQQARWQQLCDRLVASALAQPTVAVHRDWMPRNLMVTEPNPGILDFQDAVRGPISYDVASLLRDAFLSWDEARAGLGGALLGRRPQGRPAGGCRLRRVLAPAGMDGPAAPPEGAGHLLPPQAPRRQAQVQRGPAALLPLRGAGGQPLCRAQAADPADRDPDRPADHHRLQPALKAAAPPAPLRGGRRSPRPPPR